MLTVLPSSSNQAIFYHLGQYIFLYPPQGHPILYIKMFTRSKIIYTVHSLFNTTNRFILLFIVQSLLHRRPLNIWNNILSILAFLDRYGTGTVLIHLSTSVNASLIPYRSDPIRDPVFCGARSGTNCSGTDWSAQFVMWTGGSVPSRNRYGHKQLRTDPNCTGTVCTGTVPIQIWTGYKIIQIAIQIEC